MEIKQFDVWIADLNPRLGTEAGKRRPVVCIQTNLLNKADHPSTIICPITTNIKKDTEILRVRIKGGIAGLTQDCDIMMDQLRATDNNRLVKRIGKLPGELISKVKDNLKLILDLD